MKRTILIVIVAILIFLTGMITGAHYTIMHQDVMITETGEKTIIFLDHVFMYE